MSVSTSPNDLVSWDVSGTIVSLRSAQLADADIQAAIAEHNRQLADDKIRQGRIGDVDGGAPSQPSSGDSSRNQSYDAILEALPEDVRSTLINFDCPPKGSYRDIPAFVRLNVPTQSYWWGADKTQTAHCLNIISWLGTGPRYDLVETALGRLTEQDQEQAKEKLDGVSRRVAYRCHEHLKERDRKWAALNSGPNLTGATKELHPPYHILNKGIPSRLTCPDDATQETQDLVDGYNALQAENFIVTEPSNEQLGKLLQDSVVARLMLIQSMGRGSQWDKTEHTSTLVAPLSPQIAVNAPSHKDTMIDLPAHKKDDPRNAPATHLSVLDFTDRLPEGVTDVLDEISSTPLNKRHFRLFDGLEPFMQLEESEPGRRKDKQSDDELFVALHVRNILTPVVCVPESTCRKLLSDLDPETLISVMNRLTYCAILAQHDIDKSVQFTPLAPDEIKNSSNFYTSDLALAQDIPSSLQAVSTLPPHQLDAIRSYNESRAQGYPPASEDPKKLVLLLKQTVGERVILADLEPYIALGEVKCHWPGDQEAVDPELDIGEIDVGNMSTMSTEDGGPASGEIPAVCVSAQAALGCGFVRTHDFATGESGETTECSPD